MNNQSNLNKELAIYDEQLQKAFNTKICCVPDNQKSNCKGHIIKAHTISKCLGLKNISIDGKVMGLEKPILHNLHKKQGELDFSEMGIKQASVLSCFCSFHDKNIFSNIENISFSASSEQCFLLSYRSFISEWYKTTNNITEKIIINKLEESLFENGVPKFLYENRQEIIESWIENGKLNKDLIRLIKGLRYKKRDLDIDKSIYDNILLSSNFSKMNHYIFEGEGINNVLCSFSLNPNISISNKIIQNNNSSEYMVSFCVNSISNNDKGYLIFSWIDNPKNNKIIEYFFEDLRDEDNEVIERVLLEFIFKNSENTYFSINWWNQLTKSQKRHLQKWIQPEPNRNLLRIRHGMSFINLRTHYFLSKG